jgi:hypothetical protein
MCASTAAALATPLPRAHRCTLPLALLLLLTLAALPPALRAQPASPFTPPPPPQDRVAAIGTSPLRTPLAAAFSPGATFTLEAWIYLTAADTEGWLAGQAHGAPGVDPFLGYALLIDAAQRPEFSSSTGAPGSFRSLRGPTRLPLRTWTHLAAVMDGAVTRLFVNGTVAATGTALGAPPANPSIPFSVGLAFHTADQINYHRFPGLARQLRFWSVARTAAQLTAALGEELPADRTGLVAAWPLDDENRSTTARDLVTPGHPLATRSLLSLHRAYLETAPLYATTTSPRTDPADGRSISQAALIDFDSDGDLDLVLSQLNYTQASGPLPHRLRAYRNTAGHFTDVTDTVLGTVTLVHPRHQFVADFNGDGRSDVIFVGHGYDYSPFPGEQSRLLIQTPDGRLVEDPARLPQVARFTHNVSVADIDRDGDLDIFMCNVNEGALGPRLYLNDGRGFFTENASRLPAEILNGSLGWVNGSHFADVDRDGWSDLILGPMQGFARGQGSPNHLLMNDRTGRFVRDARFALPAKLVDLSATTVNIESADFNGDGAPDLVLSTDDWLVTPPDGTRIGLAVQLLLNRGDGTFTDATSSSGLTFAATDVWTEWMHPVDFTGDRRTDLVLRVITRDGPVTRLYQNLGTTPVTFREIPGLADAYSLSPPGALPLPGDLDGDGRRDLLSVTPHQILYSRNLLPLTPGRLANLSVRTQAGTGDATLIAGFALGAGTTPAATKPLLVRAIGPALGSFGVTGTLADPAVELAPLGAARLAANDNWSGTTALKNAFAAVGAFPLADDTSRDAALLVSPPSGAYTATVSGGSGVALVEVYDAGPGLSPRLTNLSARTLAGTGANALIAGFVVDGTLPKRLLLRAVGPTLAAFGVGNTLADPVLTLRPLGNETIVATNDDWSGTPALKAAFTSVGAFALAADTSRDAALILELPPGAYTATV